MTDIRSLGSTGQAVFDTASRIKEAGLIDDAKFKELTNTNVGRQDVAIGNDALNALQANTPDAKKLAFAIPRMNNDIMTLQRQALGQSQQELRNAREANPQAQQQSREIDFQGVKNELMKLLNAPSPIRNIER
jgi:hypothetical protein